MSIVKNKYGVNKNGKDVTKYTLKNSNGMEVSFIDLGATITDIIVPDRDGVFDDVVLGFDDVSSYENNSTFFGVFVGRFANRISNAKFVLNDKEYTLDQNDNTNCLHGGYQRYDYCMYDVECEEGTDGDSISFARCSPDGEQGFPGNLDIVVTYTLNNDDELILSYHAVSDKDTIINFTNHSFFNLGKGGHKCPNVLEQEVQIDARCYTPVDDILIPTGEIKELAGTALDFTEFKKLKDGIGKKDAEGKVITGYDHNFVLNENSGDSARKVAQFRAADSGRIMEVFTDQPGMQLYTAETLNVDGGRDGTHYGNFGGACFETQNFPDAVNIKNFPDAVLRAGEEFESVTVYRFKTF